MKFTFPICTKGRKYELILLILVSLCFLFGVYILQRAGVGGSFSPYLGALVIIVSFLFIHGFVRFTGIFSDEFFLPIVFLLIVLGWLEIYRLSPERAFRQMWWILIGEVAFVSVLIFLKDYRFLQDYKYVFLVSAIVLQILVAIFGVEVNGAKLWFRFKFFSIQPVEFIKIFLTIFLASYLEENKDLLQKPLWGEGKAPFLRYHILLFVLWTVAGLVLILQKDLGMVLLLFGTFIGLYYISTQKRYMVIGGMVLFIISSVFLYKVYPHVRVRIDMWLNPWKDPSGLGYQVVQSLYALANGGILGAGLGMGKPYYIPACHTDYIFVSLAEELGYVGAIFILGLYALLIMRMVLCSLKAPDEFTSFLSMGFAIMFFTQVFIIVAGSVRMIPLTGITLPFVSYGGSSLVSNFIMLAIFLQMSHRCFGKQQSGDEI